MKKTNYQELISEIKALIEGIPYPIANYANVSATIWKAMDDINWVGFYLIDNNKLILGPFQGNPACVSIEIGKGVCGSAVARKRSLIVPDVHDFPGHIACDTDSRSEIVIPMIKNGKTIGVLDIDSPLLDRFDVNDRVNLEEIVKILLKNI